MPRATPSFFSGHLPDTKQTSDSKKNSTTEPFSEKQELIKNLNTKLLSFVDLIEHISDEIFQKNMQNLLSKKSLKDPYSLNNMILLIDNYLVRLNNAKPRKKIESVAFILVLWALAVALTQIDKENSYDEFIAIMAMVCAPYFKPINNDSMHIQIATLYQMKNILFNMKSENEALAKLLNINNPHELDFRQQSYHSYVKNEEKERNAVRIV